MPWIDRGVKRLPRRTAIGVIAALSAGWTRPYQLCWPSELRPKGSRVPG